MKTLNETPLPGIQSFLSPKHPCLLQENQEACMEVATPTCLITEQVYSELAQQGFRRMGNMICRPHCDTCRDCVPVRIEVASFVPSRAQKRAWKRHNALAATWYPLQDRSEYTELYKRYQRVRHGKIMQSDDSKRQYQDFLQTSRINSKLVEFREAGMLRMVSIIDILTDGLFSAYTYYEPEMPQASFGTFNILWQIELCRTLHLPYLHLGYLVPKKSKTSYMSNFNSLQGLLHNKWQPLSFPDTW